MMFDPLTNPQLSAVADLDWREIVIFSPLILGTLALGLQPGMVFNLTAASAERLVAAYHVMGG
jgi:NADH-quinone oxidoreductase subunit M